MSSLLITCMVLVFFAVMLAIGIYCKHTSASVDGFVLGGRNVGAWLTAFAFGTSYFSAVIFVGYAGKFGWNFGLASTWVGLGNAFIGSLLAWVVLGRRTRVMTQHLQVKTMPDFFGKRYDSPALRLCSAAIVFVFLIPYTASLYNGLSRLFTLAFPKADYALCVIVMAAFTCLYVLIGGYLATAINDFIQGMVMLVGIVVIIAAVLNTQGGFTEAVAKLSEVSHVNASGSVFHGAFTSFLGPDPLSLLVVVILTSLGTWGLPQMVGKFYSIKNEAAIHKGTVISTVFAIIVAGGCYFLGGFSRLFSDTTEAGTPAVGFDALVPTMLEKLSPFLIGIVLILVLSASMSTLSSLVLTSGSTLTLDFIEPICKKQFSERKKMSMIRVLIAFFVALSAAIAIFQVKSSSESVAFIADLMGVSWGALAGSFLAPFLYGLYWKKVTKPACFASFGIGVGMSLLQLLKSTLSLSFGCAFFDSVMFRSSLHSGVFAMGITLFAVPLVSLLTRKHKLPDTDAIFSCYNKEVSVQITDSLAKS